MSSLPAISSGRVLAALQLFCLALIGLHLAAPLFAEASAWGLWPFTYLSRAAQLLLASLAILTILPHTAAAILRIAAGLPRASGLTVRQRHALFVLIALLSLLPFTLGRIVHTRWGDAYILVNAIAYPDPALRLTTTWQAPLDVWLHARLWALGNAAFGWADAWPAYRILSPLAGALYVYGLLRLADSVGRGRAEKLLIVGLLGTLGTMQLFFGYAENYSLAAAGVLLFLWLSLETLAGRRPLWQPSLALAVTIGLHPSTVVLSPALVYVAWVWGREVDKGAGRQVDKGVSGQVDKGAGRQGDEGTGRQGGRVWWSAAWQVAWPMALVAGGVLLLMELSGNGLAALTSTDRPGGGDGRLFVPLGAPATRWEHYTMFSWAHLLDWLNMQLLTAPVTLGGLAIVGVTLLADRRKTTAQVGAAPDATASSAESQIKFLAICTALYWLFTWVWNPDYGGQRDWDLFSLAAIPSTLLLARLLPRALADRGQLAQAGLMLTTVSALHTMAWIYQNMLPWEWP